MVSVWRKMRFSSRCVVGFYLRRKGLQKPTHLLAAQSGAPLLCNGSVWNAEASLWKLPWLPLDCICEWHKILLLMACCRLGVTGRGWAAFLLCLPFCSFHPASLCSLPFCPFPWSCFIIITLSLLGYPIIQASLHPLPILCCPCTFPCK